MTKTSAQVSVDLFDGSYHPVLEASYDTYRKMRLHPTVNLARQYGIAPAMLEPWNVVCEDEGIKAFVEAVIEPFRTRVIRTAMGASHDFGWKGYELSWVVKDTPSTLDKHGVERGGLRNVLVDVKALKNDITYQRINQKSGRFLGLNHDDLYTARVIKLSAQNSLFVNFDVEGYGEYGTGSSAIALSTYNEWIAANAGAARYDEKVAGAYRVCEYPEGEQLFLHPGESDPRMTNNADIADMVLSSLKSSGQCRIPIKVKKNPALTGEDTKEKTWNIYILTAGGGAQPAFISRLKYLDILILRSHGLAERSLVEGSFGTKAEAAEHADVSLFNIHLKHERIVEAFNEQVVKPLVAINFGKDFSAKVEVGRLNDEDKVGLRAMFLSLLPMSDAQALDDIDIRALGREAGVPFIETEVASGTLEEVQQQVAQ